MRKQSILHQLKHHNKNLKLVELSKIPIADLKAEYQKILDGKSTLSARERKSIIFHFTKEVKEDEHRTI